MRGSLNRVILIGNLGRDPEVRNNQNGEKIANFNMATSENWQDREGNRQEKTEWHRVLIFGKLAEVCEKYLKKGARVLIEGKIVTRKWLDNTGQDNYITEVVVSGFNGTMTMLDKKDDTDLNRQASTNAYQEAKDGLNPDSSYDNPPDYDLDDEIPF